MNHLNLNGLHVKKSSLSPFSHMKNNLKFNIDNSKWLTCKDLERRYKNEFNKK